MNIINDKCNIYDKEEPERMYLNMKDIVDGLDPTGFVWRYPEVTGTGVVVQCLSICPASTRF